jgi:hypothetical protein
MVFVVTRLQYHHLGIWFVARGLKHNCLHVNCHVEIPHYIVGVHANLYFFLDLQIPKKTITMRVACFQLHLEISCR